MSYIFAALSAIVVAGLIGGGTAFATDTGLSVGAQCSADNLRTGPRA
jgi:hypothetical protein